jgi:uncharacterized protein with FMN-binding domain
VDSGSAAARGGEASATTPGGASSATTSPQVVTGDVVRTRYGPVQVQVTLSGRDIVDVQALQLPYERSYSEEISRAVEPMLRQEALRVQYGRMRLVSGATYTSEAYANSLQSALDKAV